MPTRVFAPAAAAVAEAAAEDARPPKHPSLRALIEAPALASKNAALRQSALELGALSARAAAFAASRRALSHLEPSFFFDTDPTRAVRFLRAAAHVREVEAAVQAAAAAAVAVAANNNNINHDNAATAAAAAAADRLPSFWSSGDYGSAVVELAALGGGVLVALRANGVCVATEAPGVDLGAASGAGGAADPPPPSSSSPPPSFSSFLPGRLFLNAGPLDCVRSVFHARSAHCLVLVSVRVPGSSGDSGGAGLTCRAVAIEDVIAAVRSVGSAAGGGGGGGGGGRETDGAAPHAQTQMPLDLTPAAMDLSTWPGMGGSEAGSDSESESEDETERRGTEAEAEEDDSDDDGDEDDGEDDDAGGQERLHHHRHHHHHHHQRKRRRRNSRTDRPPTPAPQQQGEEQRRPPRAYVSRLVVASAPLADGAGPPTAARLPRVFSFLAGGGPALRLSSRGNELCRPGFVEFHGDNERALLLEPPPRADRAAPPRRRRPSSAASSAGRWGPAGRYRVLDLASYPFRALFSAPAHPGEDCRLSAELLVTLRVESARAASGGGGAGGGGGIIVSRSAAGVASRGAGHTTAPVAPWLDPFRDTSADGGRRLWGPGAAARRAATLVPGGGGATGGAAAVDVVVVAARAAATGRLLSEHRLPVVQRARHSHHQHPHNQQHPHRPHHPPPAAPMQVLELLGGACLLAKAPLSPLCFLDAVSLSVRAACFDYSPSSGPAAVRASPLVAQGGGGPDALSVFLSHPTRPLVVAMSFGGGGGGGGGGGLGDAARSWSTLSGEPLTQVFREHPAWLPGGAARHSAADTCYLSGRLDALVSLCRPLNAGAGAGDGGGGAGQRPGGGAICASCVLTGAPLGRVDPWSSSGGEGRCGRASLGKERLATTGVTAVLLEEGAGGAVVTGNSLGLVGVWSPGGGGGGLA